MAGDAVCRLSARKVHGYGNDLLRLDLKIYGVGHCEGTVRYTDPIFSSKRNLLDSLGLDLVDTGGLVHREGNCDGGDGKIGTAKDVGEFKANLVG